MLINLAEAKGISLTADDSQRHIHRLLSENPFEGISRYVAEADDSCRSICPDPNTAIGKIIPPHHSSCLFDQG